MFDISNLKFYNRLVKDIPLYVDIIEALRLELAEVVYDSDRGIIAKMKCWENYMLAAEDMEEADSLLQMLPSAEEHAEDGMMIVLRGHGISARFNELATQKYGYNHSYGCHQILFEKPKESEVKSVLVIRHPDESDFRKVASTYSLVDEETLYEHFVSPDFFGGYVNGKMIGYVGVHTEGALGMLHVFEEYRRRGFAEELSNFMINRQLSLQKVPYAQVVEDNVPSINMNKKLGATFAEDLIYWAEIKK